MKKFIDIRQANYATFYIFMLLKVGGPSIDAAHEGQKVGGPRPSRPNSFRRYVFIPIAVETMGAINSDGLEFLGDLGRRITRHR